MTKPMARTKKQYEREIRKRKHPVKGRAREDFGELVELGGNVVRRPKVRHWAVLPD